MNTKSLKIHYSSHGISVDPNEACATPEVQATAAKINALWDEYARRMYVRPIKLAPKLAPDPCTPDPDALEQRLKALDVKRRS